MAGKSQTGSYNGQKGVQRERRQALEGVRRQLGDVLFAEFLIDVLSEYGGHYEVSNLPALVQVWQTRRKLRDGAGSPPDRGNRGGQYPTTGKKLSVAVRPS